MRSPFLLKEGTMLIIRFIRLTCAAALMTVSAFPVCGQDYPSRPIRIVTNAVGGGSDLSARLVAQGISGPLGQPVVVENRGGGSAAAEIVARATPDGYTLLISGGSFTIGPLLQKDPTYDPVKDFEAITGAIR